MKKAVKTILKLIILLLAILSLTLLIISIRYGNIFSAWSMIKSMGFNSTYCSFQYVEFDKSNKYIKIIYKPTASLSSNNVERLSDFNEKRILLNKYLVVNPYYQEWTIILIFHYLPSSDLPYVCFTNFNAYLYQKDDLLVHAQKIDMEGYSTFSLFGDGKKYSDLKSIYLSGVLGEVSIDILKNFNELTFIKFRGILSETEEKKLNDVLPGCIIQPQY